MGYDDNGILEIDEEFLQPGDRVQIQVVGGLVQQQDVGISEQGSGKQDLDLLRAGKLSHQIAVQLRLDSEAVQKGLRVGLRLPAAELRELGLQLAGLDAVFIGKVFFGVKGVLFLHDLEETGITLDHGIEDDLIIIFVLVLFQEGQSLSLGNGNSAVGGIQLSAEDLKESGLSGAVGTDDAVAVSFGEFDVDIFKQGFLAES